MSSPPSTPIPSQSPAPPVVPPTSSSPIPSRETLSSTTRSRSFSLLQNINIPSPFTSRPTPLRASTTQAEVPSMEPLTPNANDLPAEIVIHIEQFLKSVTSNVHSAPFSPTQISSKFQSFYSQTFNLLPTFLPSPSSSTINLQPLLTSTEIDNRRKLRSEQLIKRQVWEEEIERRVTTSLYDRLFALKTSDDTERDMKLQGKLKALVVVGVSLEHLGVELTQREKGLLKPAIEAMGRELHALDGVKSPREKLEILLGLHKILVDGLTFPSENGKVSESNGNSSSADMLLPVLIYSIIQANTERLISNSQYIQRFRADSLLQGEASYCLTNLEAAITFLEEVDLHSLNLAPPEVSTPAVPPSMQRSTSTSSTPSLKRRTPSLPIDSADPLNALPTETNMSQVTGNDSALRSLADTLESSYKLLWSKVALPDPPKTLDDVRKLISRPFAGEDAETKEVKEGMGTSGGTSGGGGLSRLIVGSGVKLESTTAIEDPGRGNLITSGFRTLGTTISRPFTSTPTISKSPTPSIKEKPSQTLQQREMQDMESLSGTQARQLFTPEGAGLKRIKRVDARLLETEAGDVRVGDVPLLVRELRRVVMALDERGGFLD